MSDRLSAPRLRTKVNATERSEAPQRPGAGHLQFPVFPGCYEAHPASVVAAKRDDPTGAGRSPGRVGVIEGSSSPGRTRDPRFRQPAGPRWTALPRSADRCTATAALRPGVPTCFERDFDWLQPVFYSSPPPADDIPTQSLRFPEFDKRPAGRSSPMPACSNIPRASRARNPCRWRGASGTMRAPQRGLPRCGHGKSKTGRGHGLQLCRVPGPIPHR